MTRPCIVVAGQGRCGTSLVMQMLFAAGVPCDGDWPSFESEAQMIGTIDPEAFAARRDQAVKILDPGKCGLGSLPGHVVIWLDRDPVEQARSQIKFMRGHGVDIEDSRATRRGLASTLRSDRERHRAALGIPGKTPSLSVGFGILVLDPAWVAGAIAGFLKQHQWPALDTDAMTSVVRRRPSDCYPGFLENMLGRAPVPAKLEMA